MLFVMFLWLVSSRLMMAEAAHCPFPGITANTKFRDDFISWETRKSLLDRSTARYECVDGRRNVAVGELNLICRLDGTWDDPPPYCNLKLSKDTQTLDIEVGRNPARKWPENKNCDSVDSSEFYSIKLPRNIKRIDSVVFDFCDGRDKAYFTNTTLDRLKQCSVKNSTSSKNIEYVCHNFSPTNKELDVILQLSKPVKLDNIYAVANPGNHCGWPPVPEHADVVTQLIPGQTTRVTYKCNDPLILDPKGPETSTCDQMTGRWSQLPKCICPNPDVPVNGRMIHRSEFSARFQCANGFRLTGNEEVSCDHKGRWGELPSCLLNLEVITSVLLAVLLLLNLKMFRLLDQTRHGDRHSQRGASKQNGEVNDAVNSLPKAQSSDNIKMNNVTEPLAVTSDGYLEPRTLNNVLEHQYEELSN